MKVMREHLVETLGPERSDPEKVQDSIENKNILQLIVKQFEYQAEADTDMKNDQQMIGVGQ